MALGCGIRQPTGEARQLGGEDHPDRDRGAVAPPVALGVLDRVTERVAVVEDLAEARFAEVLAHDVRLHLDRELDRSAGTRRCADRRRHSGSASMRSRISGAQMKPALTTSA